MNKEIFSSNKAIANNSGAMEIETIQKNGASSKSRTSREIFSSIGIFISILLCVLFTACSSPESDGIKVAKRYSGCLKTRIKVATEKMEVQLKEYSNIAENFDSYNFQTSNEVRAELQKHYVPSHWYEAGENEQDNECSQKANEYEHKISEKYKTNEEKYRAFRYARENYDKGKHLDKELEKIRELQSEINSQSQIIDEKARAKFSTTN